MPELQHKPNNPTCNGLGGFKRTRSKYKNVIELNIARKMKSSPEFLTIKKNSIVYCCLWGECSSTRAVRQMAFANVSGAVYSRSSNSCWMARDPRFSTFFTSGMYQEEESQ